MSARRFVLLDRDGTLIVERNYLSDPAGVELLPNAAEGLYRLRELGLGLVVITNQSGIGRGMFDEQMLHEIHDRMIKLFAAQGVQLDGIYFCPHLPGDNCACRKPRPELALRAARDLGFDPRQSFAIGDKPCDILMGRAVGAQTLLVRTGYGNEYPADQTTQPDFTVADLAEAADVIGASLAAQRS